MGTLFCHNNSLHKMLNPKTVAKQSYNAYATLASLSLSLSRSLSPFADHVLVLGNTTNTT